MLAGADEQRQGRSSPYVDKNSIDIILDPEFSLPIGYFKEDFLHSFYNCNPHLKGENVARK